MRLPPPAMRWPASSGISGISDCMRARLTALTRLRSPATSWTIGSCDGLREPTRRWIVARISLAMWRQSRAKASQTGLAWRVIAPQRGRITTKEARVTDETLRGFRQSIDNIDAALIHMLAERFRVPQAVGRYTAAAGRAGARGTPDRAAAPTRRGRAARPRIQREVPALHHRRGDPPPRASARHRGRRRAAGVS